LPRSNIAFALLVHGDGLLRGAMAGGGEFVGRHVGGGGEVARG
jgi:hypothetical protein